MNNVYQELPDSLRDLLRKMQRMPARVKQFGIKHWIRIWWKLSSGTEISIPWPSGWTPPDHLGNSIDSADPNDWYRPWLEQHVGRQFWDWNWDLGDIVAYGGRGELLIKFRKEKDHWASMFLLTVR